MDDEDVHFDIGLTHIHLEKGCWNRLSQQVIKEASGVVSGTTVWALVLGRFSQKKLKIELKDIAKNE